MADAALDIGYSTQKTYGLLNEALPFLLGICCVHFAIKKAIHGFCGHWKTREGFEAAGWTAFNGTVLLYDVVSLGFGLTALFNGQMSSLAGSPHDRVHGYSSFASSLCALTAAFEAYNTALCVLVYPQGLAMIGHHVVTFGLAFIGTAPYVHFYALFFFGIANLSSVALAGYTVCEALKPRYAIFERLHAALQVAFALLFLCVRVAIWPCVSARFWLDTYMAHSEGWTHSYPATGVLLLSNIFLTGLQFMWGRKVWRKVQRALKGSAADYRPTTSPPRAAKGLAERQSRTSDEQSSSSSDDGQEEVPDSEGRADKGVQRRTKANEPCGLEAYPVGSD
jgi:hypothetical protein